MIKHGMLIAGAMLAGVAAAETPEQRQACTDDAFQFCSDAIPDRERVFACGSMTHCLPRRSPTRTASGG